MQVKHIYNSKLALFIGANITLYPFIFYIGSPTEDIVVHEMIHVKQILEVGWLYFYLSYLGFYLKNRVNGLNSYEAYLAIPYEVEAYAEQQKFIDFQTT